MIYQKHVDNTDVCVLVTSDVTNWPLSINATVHSTTPTSKMYICLRDRVSAESIRGRGTNLGKENEGKRERERETIRDGRHNVLQFPTVVKREKCLFCYNTHTHTHSGTHSAVIA